MITLYDYELSGNCYKLRLLMSFLGIEYRTVPVDFYPGREHKSEWFLKLNPLGQLPVIEDGGLILRDAQAILVYLASKYDRSGTWYPRDNPDLLGEVSQWLAFADGITATASAARLHDALFYVFDIDAARAGAHRLFRILDEHLWFSEQQGRNWICPAGHPTIADIACFPYIILSEEGGIPRQDYPAIRRWCDRVKRIKGFTVMSGVFPAGPARAAA
ncbi:glutathione S-transferase family protein [Mesorhizobium sp. B2-4-12]|uniref:glutathione S-transferase family protein n=1 Tax=Mesorhizobium sp. B2-4-12 TaxID=2589937 RepID=UPI0011294EA3|nr:glutathione S-transferase [Mesorhizobium sp. B2-4-12]TPK94469.1 glutathione S-transferase family protein [Mesorhizobium sp. B2-4-12]